MNWMPEIYCVDNEPILNCTDSGILTSAWMVVYPSIYCECFTSHPDQRPHSFHSYLAILYLAEVSKWNIEDKLSDFLIEDCFMSWIHYLYSIKTKHIQYLLCIVLRVWLYITFWKRHIWMIFIGYVCTIGNIFITTYRNFCCLIKNFIKND